MTCPRFFLACIAFVSIPGPIWPQLVKAIDAGAEAKELRRTAFLLRVPADQLKNARVALQEATDLVKREPTQLSRGSIDQIGQRWIDLNRPKAAAVLEELIGKVRADAQNATSMVLYGNALSAAEALLRPYSILNPDRALEYARQWPAPPAAAGEMGERSRTWLLEYLQSSLIAYLPIYDPDAAMRLAAEAKIPIASNYNLAGQVAMNMMRKGQRTEALQLVDQTLADFNQRRSEPAAIEQFGNFMSRLAKLDSDRFITAMTLWAGSAPVSPGHYGSLKAGDRTVDLNYSEGWILETLRNLYNRPELVTRVMNSLPELKAKLDQIGGLDAALSPGPFANSTVTITSRSGASGGSASYSYGGGSGATGLYEELLGKASRNPEMVRSRLSAAARDPGQFSNLISIAERAKVEDPDLSSMALATALQILNVTEPAQKRATLFRNYVRAQRQCEGTVDRDILREGFVLADNLRQETKETNYFAGDFERFLVAELAVDDFDAAMSYVRPMPDNAQKAMALLAIVQSLTQRH